MTNNGVQEKGPVIRMASWQRIATEISSLKLRQEGATTLSKVHTNDLTSLVRVRLTTTQGIRRNRIIESSSHP